MAVTSSLEIERKYDVDERTPVPPLGELGEVRVEEAVTLRAVYFDTADRALARHRIALRRRAGGHDEGWHLKLPAALGRTELHAPLASEPPAELLDRVRAVLRGRELGELARLSTSRSVVRVLDAAGAPVVEIADDLVSATDVTTGILRIWREWEAELLEGAPVDDAGRTELLDRVERLLLDAGAREASSASKLARALGRSGLGVESPLPAPRKKGPAIDVAVTVLAELADALVALDSPARLDEPDAVHRLRTTLRRVRSVLSAFRGVLDADAAEPLRAAAAEIGGVLGRARDLEVRRELVDDLLDRRAKKLGDIAVQLRAEVDAAIDADRERARADVDSALSGERWFGLLDGLDALVAGPPAGPRATAPARQHFDAVLRAEVTRTRKRLKKVDVADLESAHDARKAARRLRYVAEALAGAGSVYGAKARTLAGRAQAVQDAVGDARDAELAAEYLEQLAETDAERAVVLRDLAARERKEAARAMAGLDELGARLVKAGAALA